VGRYLDKNLIKFELDQMTLIRDVIFILDDQQLIKEMKITELTPGIRGVSVEGKIESIAEPRTVNLRAGGTARVADAVITDDSGSIKLSLWDDQIDMVQEGDAVVIENGYTQAFRGDNSLNIGRYGKLRKV
jgi:replication factor A1